MQSVSLPVRIMAANRLASEGRSWSRILARGNPAERADSGSSSSLQWLTIKPKDSSVWLIEQHPSMTHAVNYSENFANNGFVFCDGNAILPSSGDTGEQTINSGESLKNLDLTRFFADNVTSVQDIRNLMRPSASKDGNVNGSSSRVNTLDKGQSLIFSGIGEFVNKFVYRGDVETPKKSYGVIDTKITVATASDLETFEATSGPPYFGRETIGNYNRAMIPFNWSTNFPDVLHIGQPDKFQFDGVVPQWVWF